MRITAAKSARGWLRKRAANFMQFFDERVTRLPKIPAVFAPLIPAGPAANDDEIE